ncbi:MAG: hypothetical protein BWX66_01052 [Deltaproteobacteria bacterium ADurb.Bin058]|nr:MAG: hypothetical protein BWX66_01052 [Deltaproteobacteria bacterium ADurb.Bin058]
MILGSKVPQSTTKVAIKKSKTLTSTTASLENRLSIFLVGFKEFQRQAIKEMLKIAKMAMWYMKNGVKTELAKE